MKHSVFNYGINIRGCPTFTREKMRHQLESPLAKYRLLGIGIRPDTLVVESLVDGSINEAAQWIASRIRRPTVARNLEIMPALYEHALKLGQRQAGAKFDVVKLAANLEGQWWKLGVVFASEGVPAGITFQDSNSVKVLGMFQNDTVIVLKREKRGSGSRITWGEQVNRIVREPSETVLNQNIVCTSRSISTVKWLANWPSHST